MWGAMKTFDRFPAAVWDSKEPALEYATHQAEATGYDYKVVKIVETYKVLAPICRCVPKVEEVSEDERTG